MNKLVWSGKNGSNQKRRRSHTATQRRNDATESPEKAMHEQFTAEGTEQHKENQKREKKRENMEKPSKPFYLWLNLQQI